MGIRRKIARVFFSDDAWSRIVSDVRLNVVGVRAAVSPTNRKRLAMLRQKRDLRLHLGAGTRYVDGWVNIDISSRSKIDLVLDLRKPLPFPDQCVNQIYSEHMLEHLVRVDALRLLRECRRVMAPGAVIRLGVPDAEVYIRAYAEGDRAFFESLKHLGGAVEPLNTRMDVINQMFRMGGDHRFAWDFECLEKALVDNGFVDVVRSGSGQSCVEGLCLDDPDHAFETLYVEARTPQRL